MELKRGAARTIIWNVTASLRGGKPESVTRTVTGLVVVTGTTGVFQMNWPFVGLIMALAGAPGSRLKVRAWAGKSRSMAVTPKISKSPPLTFVLVIAKMLGGLLTSLTT